jgi:YegS/Rv2252/BmrU family lipid kinase
MGNHQYYIILNPASSNGKTGKRISEIKNAAAKFFGQDYTLHVTEYHLHAAEIARQIVSEDGRNIIAAGGDGTINEIINGIFSHPLEIRNECTLGIINGGTGQGFSQSIGLPAGLEKQLELIKSGRTNMVDIGYSKFKNQFDEEVERYFINEFQIGIGGEVVERVERKGKRWGGRLSFGLRTIQSIISYTDQPLSIIIDDKKMPGEKFFGVIVANGAFMGGGMHLAPNAKVNDGVFNVLLIHETKLLQRFLNFSKIYSGQHIYTKHFSYIKAKSIHVESSIKTLVEADGELLGTTPCSTKIIPNALRVYSNMQGNVNNI